MIVALVLSALLAASTAWVASLAYRESRAGDPHAALLLAAVAGFALSELVATLFLVAEIASLSTIEPDLMRVVL